MRFSSFMILAGMLLHVFTLCAQKNSRTLKVKKDFVYGKKDNGQLQLVEYNCDSFSVEGILQTSVGFQDYYFYYPRFDTSHIFNTPGEQRSFSLRYDDGLKDTSVSLIRFDQSNRVVYSEYFTNSFAQWNRYEYDQHGKLILKEDGNPRTNQKYCTYYFLWGDSTCGYSNNVLCYYHTTKVYNDKTVIVQILFKNNQIERESRYVRDSVIVRKEGRFKIREYYNSSCPFDGSYLAFLSRKEKLDRNDSIIQEIYYQPDAQCRETIKAYERTVSRRIDGKKTLQIENKGFALDTTFYNSPLLEVRHHSDGKKTIGVDSVFYNKTGKLVRMISYDETEIIETLVTDNQNEYIETVITYMNGELVFKEIYERKYY